MGTATLDPKLLAAATRPRRWVSGVMLPRIPGRSIEGATFVVGQVSAEPLQFEEMRAAYEDFADEDRQIAKESRAAGIRGINRAEQD